MTEIPQEGLPPIVITGNPDAEEALLESREVNKYLLAKSFFDCREYDRCAAVFLPDTVLSGILSAASTKTNQSTSTSNGKAKGKSVHSRPSVTMPPPMPRLSQKSLFLALYAKFMSGEKKKDEDTEMVMGPQDGGSTANKELIVISRFLEVWFRERSSPSGDVTGSQGWLEYLLVYPLQKVCNNANTNKIWNGPCQRQKRRRSYEVACPKYTLISNALGMLVGDDFPDRSS